MNLYGNQSALGKKYILHNGILMPAVGLSTYRCRSESAVYNVVDQALGAGYRLFDTSSLFCNEQALRNAFSSLLPKYDLDRTDIFITSKLVAVDSNDYSIIRTMFDKTLSNMGMDYIDLYLISNTLQASLNLKRAWEELQTLQYEGYANAIGVANFTVGQLREIIEDSAVPTVNQVEWHPLKNNEGLYDFCKIYNIKLQAYSPFGTPFANHKRLFHNRIIKNLAAKYEVPPSQIILMWSLQQEVAVVPSTHVASHLKENIDFEMKLSARDMDRISALAPDSDDSDPEV